MQNIKLLNNLAMFPLTWSTDRRTDDKIGLQAFSLQLLPDRQTVFRYTSRKKIGPLASGKKETLGQVQIC